MIYLITRISATRWNLLLSMKSWFIFTIAATALVACQSNTIEIRGRVISYDYIELNSMKLVYWIMNNDESNEIPSGTARIKSDGEFRFRIKKQHKLPYWVLIHGVDAVPEVSVTNNSYEIVDNQITSIDMGDVYIYDNIIITSEYNDPLTFSDLEVQWESNIPDVDFYVLELAGKMTISGIKDTKFSFQAIRPMIGTKGHYQLDDMDIYNNNDRIYGSFFICVRAARVTGGKTVVVATSNFAKMATIVQ
jgi:hypothetical protein